MDSGFVRPRHEQTLGKTPSLAFASRQDTETHLPGRIRTQNWISCPAPAAQVMVLMSRDRLIPLIVAVALFMENMDSTVIATSLPAIAADIGTNPLALKLA